ncbi:MAG: HEAT repeat domain-containing protein, partial [Patescibacteria group bacterium]|nr:HEAT repeat domain-containing protein [Patescibacteria group bacterium]
SLGELAKISPEKFIPLYEKGIRDSDWEVTRATAESLGELAKISPEKFIPLYEKGIRDSDVDVRCATAESLGELAKIFDYNQEKRIRTVFLEKNKLSETDLNFFYQVIITLLKHNEELSKCIKDYLPRYLYLKKLANEVNEHIDETKRWQNPEEFFINHNLDIVNLFLIDPNLSTQLFKNHLIRGLSFTEAYLEVIHPILDNPSFIEPIKAYLQTNKNLDGYNFSDLLEIAAAYHTLKAPELFAQVFQSPSSNFEELKLTLNKNLLKKVAEDLNIKTEIKDQDLTQWKLKYIANLVTNQTLIKEKCDEEILEFTNAVLKSVFENRFQEFISALNQKDEIGREIAKHNQKVEQEFKKYNINWDNWLNFKEQLIMTVGTAKKQNQEALFNQFENRLQYWIDSITEPSLKRSLEKDLIQLKQKKKEFDPSKINLNDPHWLEQLLPTYTKSLNYLKNKNPNFELPNQTQEAFGHLLETIKSLTEQQQKEQTLKKEFIVKIWDRNPKKDLFQGNFTGCCIAVGVKEPPPGELPTFHPETIFQYLIDKGINVAEIVDPGTNDPVAQTWLFVTLDQNKKPVLIADNFEVNKKYPTGHNVNYAIGEAMFQFLSKYAQACNIEKVGLGQVGTNDIDDDHLPSFSLPPIKKLGGYFYDREYYLETLKDTSVLAIKREVSS